MITKILLPLCISILISQNAICQSTENFYKTGAFVDASGQTIDGYFDFTFSPKKKTTCELTIGIDFTPGYYYDNNKQKITGLLKYNQNNANTLLIHTSGTSKGEKIKPEDCLGYVIGNDSFTVIQNFNVERAIGPILNEDKEYAEVITTINDLTFYKHTRYGSNNTVSTIHVRKGLHGQLVSFPKAQIDFNNVALTYFGNVEYLQKKIKNDEYTSANLIDMIKYLDYWTKYKKKEKIYYTSSWEETKDTSRTFYYATITGIEQEIFKLSYFIADHTPLYQGQYNSLAPMKKYNTFTFYFPNGMTRKKVSYEDNIPTGSIEEYHTNGILHYKYTLSKKQKQKFERVIDINENDVLDLSGNGIEIFFDSIQNREITRTFKKFSLITSYYQSDKGTKTYQYCKGLGTKNTNLNAVEDKLRYPASSIKEYNHGLVVVKIIADETGKTTFIDIVKGLDKTCDSEVLRYCQNFYKGNIWYPLKIDKTPIQQEIILSFLFELKGFSVYRNNYYNNNFWMQPMMMQNQQQMMMQNISAPRF